MPTQDTFINGLTTLEFKFTAGGTLSNQILTSGATLAALCFSSDFTAANVSVGVSPDGVYWYYLTDGTTGLQYVLNCAPQTAIPVDIFFTNGFRYFQLLSLTTQPLANIVQAQFIPLVNKDWN
jgi:hypothetical protein